MMDRRTFLYGSALMLTAPLATEAQQAGTDLLKRLTGRWEGAKGPGRHDSEVNLHAAGKVIA
jgi:hypothetical protein